MSVDFFPCNSCGESICDCGTYFGCYKCGSSLCDGCAEKYKCGDFADISEEWPIEDEDGQEIDYTDDFRNCPYCDLREIHESDLLSFALEQLNITCEELKNQYKKSRVD